MTKEGMANGISINLTGDGQQYAANNMRSQPGHGEAPVLACEHLLLRDATTSTLPCYSVLILDRMLAACGNAFLCGRFEASTGLLASHFDGKWVAAQAVDHRQMHPG